MGSVGGGKFRKIRYDVMGTNIYTLSGERAICRLQVHNTHLHLA